MTLKEIYQSLIDGKKIRHMDWLDAKYIWLVGNSLCNERGKSVYEEFTAPENWYLYEEPEDLENEIEADRGSLSFYLETGSWSWAANCISKLIDLKIQKAMKGKE